MIAILPLSVLRIRSWCYPLQCLQVFGQHKLESFPEVEAHFTDPLTHEPLRGDDQGFLYQPAKFQLHA